MYVLKAGVDDPLFMIGTSTFSIITPRRGFYVNHRLSRVSFMLHYYSVSRKTRNVVYFTDTNRFKLVKKIYSHVHHKHM